ncbi:MAG: TetR/AcrR family transcriptional regulator [Spirochaetaceae bacterium]|nr:TetR/AcrR family transcriptional regulator [Spirochaetaceae bacterium]
MEKRDLILKAAIECFTNYGYSKTTMSDIGRIVGMNKASLYYHFKDKLALYSAVVYNLRSEHMITLRNNLKSKTLAEQIIEFLKSEIDFSQIIAMNYLSGNSEMSQNKDETQSVFQEIIADDIKQVSAMIANAVKKGELNNCDPVETARMILMVSNGLLQVQCPLDMALSEREAGYKAVKHQIEQVIGLMLKGLAPC